MVQSEMMVIVLADDDDGHAHLVTKNLQRSGIVNPILRARNGCEVLDLVRLQLGENMIGAATEPMPLVHCHRVLLILDINMPTMNGFEVLKELKSSPATALIPIFVLTTTDNPDEVHRSYELGCNVYMTKPVNSESFLEATSRLGMFIQYMQVPNAGEFHA